MPESLSTSPTIANENSPAPYHDTYLMAEHLVQAGGLSYLIDLSYILPTTFFQRPSSTPYLGIHGEQHQPATQHASETVRFVPHNFQEVLRIDVEILKEAVVVCTNTVEYGYKAVLETLAYMAQYAPYVLITAPSSSFRDCEALSGLALLGKKEEKPAYVSFQEHLTQAGISTTLIGKTYGTTRDKKDGVLAIAGTHAMYQQSKPLRILALVSSFNDEDIIEEVIEHLIKEGLYVWCLDNWSSDATWMKLNELKQKHPERIVATERYPHQGADDFFDWSGILRRKEDIAQSTDFDWYIQHDSDELRSSPWPNITLAQAISFVASLGYTAIDHTQLDFRPTQDGFSSRHNAKSFFSHFLFDIRPNSIKRVNSWARQNESVNLPAKGGHDIAFANKRVFPLKFTTGHYSLRSSKQGQRKVHKERLPRFERERAEKDWHAHFDSYKQVESFSFIWGTSNLLPYGKSFDQTYLIERLTTIGPLEYFNEPKDFGGAQPHVFRQR